MSLRSLSPLRGTAVIAALLLPACDERPTAPADTPSFAQGPLNPAIVARGREIFRFDTFGDETFWTDTLRMHEVIRTDVSPAEALAVGLKVDVDALPASVKAALAAGTLDLDDPANTVALLSLGAVVGVAGQVDGAGTLVSVGITCALCHSNVDDSFDTGIGKRLDGWAAGSDEAGHLNGRTLLANSPDWMNAEPMRENRSYRGANPDKNRILVLLF